MISSKESKPTPPFLIYLLNNLIPRTIFDNYTSWAYLSVTLKEIKGLNPTLGNTLSSAAATYRSTIFAICGVSYIVEYLPNTYNLFLNNK